VWSSVVASVVASFMAWSLRKRSFVQTIACFLTEE
jgi:hypothetical protein